MNIKSKESKAKEANCIILFRKERWDVLMLKSKNGNVVKIPAVESKEAKSNSDDTTSYREEYLEVTGNTAGWEMNS